jgi:hypothetical protein
MASDLGGRPPHFETSNDLQAAINDYFNNGVTKRKRIIGKAPNEQLVEIEVPTITGLCYYIGFQSRQSFYDYEEREGFSYTVKRARLFIEKEYEEQLTSGNTIGAIFALKNMGWRDKTEQEITGKDGAPITPQIIINPIQTSAAPIQDKEPD